MGGSHVSQMSHSPSRIRLASLRGRGGRGDEVPCALPSAAVVALPRRTSAAVPANKGISITVGCSRGGRKSDLGVNKGDGARQAAWRCNWIYDCAASIARRRMHLSRPPFCICTHFLSLSANAGIGRIQAMAKVPPDIDGLSYRPKTGSRSVVNRRNPLRFLQASGLAIGPGGLKNFPISV